MLLELFVEIKAWDRDGKVIHHKKELSRSPVRQFLQILLAQFQQAQSQTIKNTDGYDQTVADSQYSFNASAPATVDTFGIVVGTDPTAVDMTDIALAAQIAHGTGSGELLYQGMGSDASVTTSDPDAYFEMWRNFNNNSGGTIIVKETAFYCKAGANTWYFLTVRDVPTQVAVPDGGGCYVKYQLKITE